MGNNKFKILIVEDEANIRSFIKANLEISDYQVLCAETCALGMMMADRMISSKKKSKA